uniref:THAP domain-containing protein 1 n=1 Tax=Iconisemion striatum TaxID=60296 RepID=A0A1A7Y6L4_9TELE
MPHCAAFGCNFQSKVNKGSDVSLHSFPTDKKRRKQWEDACGRTQLPKDPRLCSRHFFPDAFEAYSRPQLLKDLTGAAGYKRRLKLNALPTIFPHKEPKHPRRESEMRCLRDAGRSPEQTTRSCSCCFCGRIIGHATRHR